MKRNRRVRSFNEEAETKKLIYISVAVVIIAILTFVITYVVYSNVLSNSSDDTDLALKLTQLSASNNEQSSQASSMVGKNVNEVMGTQNAEEDTTKIAINTSNMENKKIEESKEIEENKEESISETSVNVTNSNIATNSEVATNKVENVPDPTFIKPVEGEILREYAKETLVYSETLKEWITHSGIDIKAEKTTIVKSAAEGTIKSIKNDPRYGITVVIEHVNGYVSIYSNLLTAEFVKEREEVKQGQTIGTVGNTAIFEIADEPHLHFEILKDNEYLNPSEYIK